MVVGLVALVLVGTLAFLGWDLADRAEPAPSGPTYPEVPASDLHLPRHVVAPDPRTEGTEEAGPPGPLAAVAQAEREVDDSALMEGWPYGVSAVDGSVRFLDLELAREGRASVVLSPNGRLVATHAMSVLTTNHV